MQLPNLPGTDSLYKFAAIAGSLTVIASAAIFVECASALETDISARAIEAAVLTADTEKLKAEVAIGVGQVNQGVAQAAAQLKSTDELQAHLQKEIEHSKGAELGAVLHRADKLMRDRLAETGPQVDRTLDEYAALQFRVASEGGQISTRAKELLAKLARDEHWLHWMVGLLVCMVITGTAGWSVAKWGFRLWYQFQKMQDALLTAQFDALKGAAAAETIPATGPSAGVREASDSNSAATDERGRAPRVT